MDALGNGQDAANAARGVVSDVEAEICAADPSGQVEEGNPPEGREEDQSLDQPQQEQHNPVANQQSQEDPLPQPPSQQLQQQIPPFPPPWHPQINHSPPPAGLLQPPIPPPSQHAIAMAQYYEARMRDHAAAYASAAAGAAWAAAQIAAQAAEFAASTYASLGIADCHSAPMLPPAIFDPNAIPPVLPVPLPLPHAGYYQDPNLPPMLPMGGEPDANYFHPVPDNGNQWRNQQQQRDYNDYDYGDAFATRNSRRKRTQRRPPGGISVPLPGKDSDNQRLGNNNGNAITSNNNNSRVRRRLRDQVDSSNSSCATSITSYNSDQALGVVSGGNGHRNNCNYGGQRQRTAGRGGTHYHRYKKRMKQPRDDASLLGKTGVSALYEWCGKRRLQPSFVLLSPLPGSSVSVEAGEEFEMAVYLEDGIEWGRGRGQSKGSAKQEAARLALEALVPGVIFDSRTGFLVELPTNMVPPNAFASPNSQQQQGHPRGCNPASLEDLAPHLAERLAIATGRDDENDDGNKSAARGPSARQLLGGADYSSKTLKRAWNVYPGTTSTTNSEDDDENAYYASRGASVCSVLLHAMVQIDDRIPEAPQYLFEVAKVPTANSQTKRKDPASSCGSAVVVQRGSFTCTATLKILSPFRDQSDVAEETSDTKDTALDRPKSDEKSRPDEDRDTEESEVTQKHPPQATVLTAVGVGGTKRESKHTASAKLLALLFPECRTMVEVKAAAEAAREAYAASKSQNIANANNRRRQIRSDARSKIPRLSLSSGISQLNATPTEEDPPLPDALINELRAILGVQQPANKLSTISSQVASFQKLNINQESSSDPVDAAALRKINEELEFRSDLDSESPASSREQDAMSRLLSRRKQLDALTDKALAALNEHDEDGRSLPGELTVDDIGRTVLRRAEPEDIDRFLRLLSCHSTSGNNMGYLCPASTPGAPLMARDDGSEESDGKCSSAEAPVLISSSSPLSLSSSILLLLCRKVAALEDPPLGCAVLNLGFSMQKGRILRIARIGSEPHLPRERFLECVEAFAVCMGYELESQEPDIGCDGAGVRLKKADLIALLESHLQLQDGQTPTNSIADPLAEAPEENYEPTIQTPSSRTGDRNRNASVSAPLQSVLEESEGGDDSDRPKEANGKAKTQDKPCKRSRVE